MTVDSKCVFCQIASGETPAKVFIDEPDVIAVADINPMADYHALVIPKKHIASFSDVKVDDFQIIQGMIKVAQKLISDNKLSSGYKILFNGGMHQLIPHLHMHVMGGNLKREDDVLNKT